MTLGLMERKLLSIICGSMTMGIWSSTFYRILRLIFLFGILFFFSPLSHPFKIISDDVLAVTWWFQDIRSSGETKKIGTLKAWKAINEQHIAHQYQYSLRVSQL